MPIRRAIALTALLAGVGCTQSAATAPSSMIPPGGTAAQGASRQTSPIRHVIVVVQEKRSFDSLFCKFPGADGAFDEAPLAGGKPAGLLPYVCIEPREIEPYTHLAERFALADRMFSTAAQGDFEAHQELIAGTIQVSPGDALIGSPDALPWGCDAPPGTTIRTSIGRRIPPCFTYRSMAGTLDAAGVSWRYYTPPLAPPGDADLGGEMWNAFDAIEHVRYGPDWRRNVSMPNTNLFTDIRSGTLPSVSWVIPTFADSDDPLSRSKSGPAWVKSIVDAVGPTAYWKNTAILVVWDDWGGFYDHVPPQQLDFGALGFRVPLILVSPLQKA